MTQRTTATHKVVYDATKCRRCNGQGVKGYNQTFGNKCLTCKGTGRILTPIARESYAAVLTLLASYKKPSSEFNIGDKLRADFWPVGMCVYTVTKIAGSSVEITNKDGKVYMVGGSDRFMPILSDEQTDKFFSVAEVFPGVKIVAKPAK